MENHRSTQPILFDEIAPRYDFLNHLLSVGIDISWRRKLVNRLPENNQPYILDVATGTADLAIMAAKRIPCRIIGYDIADRMLEIGERKIAQNSLTHKIQLIRGSVEDLPFADNSFDAVMVAFGVRNFKNLPKGLSEMYRVLKPDGISLILEFSIPENKIVRNLYHFYFFRIFPLIGGWLSKNRKAYTYLPESGQQFPQGKHFERMLKGMGFRRTTFQSLTFGIAILYEAIK